MGKSGLCCIHSELHNKGFGFKTMTWKRFSDLGKEKSLPILCRRYEDNVFITSMIIEECAKMGWNYRVNGSILPLLTHPKAELKFDDLPNNKTLYSHFSLCCDIAKKHGVRLSSHPDQFNVLASENQKAVDQTILELNHHGWIMFIMQFYCIFHAKGLTIEDCIEVTPKNAQAGYNSPINIHINNSKGNPKDIAKRFKEGLDRLEENAKSRLVVEVEDKGIWNAKNLVEHIHGLTGIPVTFDYLHHKCNPGGLTEKEAFVLCAKTWGDIKPLFHFSEALPGQSNPRKHANVPTYTPDTYGYDVDLDYEFKFKDLALKEAQKIAMIS